MTKDAFLAAMNDEVDRISFLAAKLTPDELSFRLAPSARTTAKLLQYLSTASMVPARALVTGNYEHFAEYKARGERVTLESFAKALDSQRKEIADFVGSISDADWSGRVSKLPWGTERPLCDAMVESSLAFLIGYRMQLFLHLKANGHDDYTTWECWGGKDNPERVGTE